MVVGDLSTYSETVVIGGGPGGYLAAIRLAQLGKEVTIVEKEWIGGVCLNYGCIPSKALIYAVNQYDQAKNMGHMGITCNNVKIDITKLQDWKNKSVLKLRDGIQDLFQKYNIKYIPGEAFFESSNKIKVVSENGTSWIEFDKAIIATGSRPRVLEGLEPDGKQVVTSRELVNLNFIPPELVIIGAGFICLEMSSLFAKLGTRVTIVARSILAKNVDRDVLSSIYEKMKELGIIVMENTTIDRVNRTKEGVTLYVKNTKTNEMSTVQTTHVAVVAGRIPNTNHLQLEKTRVKLDEHGFIRVNEQRKTHDPHLYALGDITGDPMLAHKAYKEGRVAAESIAGLPAAMDTKLIPVIIFSDPEIATVGLSEQECKEQGIEIKVGKFPFSALGRAVSVNKDRGFVKVIADKEGQLLGVHIVGPHATDLISEATLGMELGANLEDIALTVHPHPTFPEALMEAAEHALGRSIHIKK